MDVSLAGRSAVITGGSKGLGLAMAKMFSASGADVVILARDAGGLEAARKEIAAGTNGKVEAISCDVADPAQIQSAYNDAMKALGKIDIVVNNAGKAAGGAFESITDAAWQSDFDLKVFAAIRLTRLVWPQMKERRWGRVINVLAISAKAPGRGSAPSSISRAAGMALTKALAGEGAAHNILCNALLVGQIESDQLMRSFKARTDGVSYEDHLVQAGARTPLGRVGKAEEFAATACFLASDHAGYLNGVAINVDGGASPVV